MTIQKVLVAGATGQLGKAVVAELKRRGYWVRALGRDARKLQVLKQELGADEIVTADLTDYGTLKGGCDQIDAVISCAGASMSMNNFGDRKSFYEVDYQANLNLLADAERQTPTTFVYVSLAEADKLRQTEYADAHEKFVEVLRRSDLKSCVIRPTGFFGFHLEILKFAAKGRGMLIGSGECRTNPVHEADVARACVDALESDEAEIVLGGPEIFTRKETVELAFAALNRPPKLMKFSPGMFKLMIAPLKLINRRVYALMDFGIAVTQIDVVAPSVGSQRLKPYFEQAAKTL
jgi:uncharacterized protein YbjT (DUF2867 family)